MTAQELATCAIEDLPIKVLIFNNGFLGMVRQWQELFYDERYSEVHLAPRRSRLREAGRGLRLRRPALRPGRGRRRRCSRRRWRSPTPPWCDFRVPRRERVFPMVPGGQVNDEIVLGPEFGRSPSSGRGARKRSR